MTFVDMVRDLKRDFATARLPKANAMMQLAGMVKDMVSSIGRDTDAAIAEMGKAKARVYMPKKTRAKGAKEDSELAAVKINLEEKAKAAAEKKAVRDKLATLDAFTKSDQVAQEEMISQVLSARRAKAREKEAVKAEAAKLVAERKEGVRAEFKERFSAPDVIGKTERFEGYMQELKAAVEKERAGYEAAGVEYKNTALLKELAEAQKTGKVQEAVASARGEKLLGKLSNETQVVGRTVSELHEDMTAQLLGPFAGIYKTSKNFMMTTLKHYTVDKKDTIKKWLQDKLDQKKLLAEMVHLRKETGEVSGTLKMQMMVSTVMNGLISGIGMLLKASPFLALGAYALVKLGEAIGEAIFKKLPPWMGGGTAEKENEASDKAAEARRERRGLGVRTDEDIQREALEAKFGPLAMKRASGTATEKELEQYQQIKDHLEDLKKQEMGRGKFSVSDFVGKYTMLPALGLGTWGGRSGRLESDKEYMESIANATDRMAKSADKMAAQAVSSGASVSVNSMTSMGGGEKVHSNVAKNMDLYSGPADDEIVW